MKTLKDLCNKTLESLQSRENVVCEYVMTPWGENLLSTPAVANEYTCTYCGGKDYYLPFLDPKCSDARVWLCANEFCDIYVRKVNVTYKTVVASNVKLATPTPVEPQRAIGWASWCEINGIGDVHYDVSFDSIDQPQGKIDYLKKFSEKPRGIVFMQGDPGAGKSYCALGLCELFTRTSRSCIYMTQKQMHAKWTNAMKSDNSNKFISQVMNCSLLVIDDFGTADSSPGFMSYFMDVIDTRGQWTNRGTVITTNLNDAVFAEFCGAALSDRVRIGTRFKFEGNSRRTSLTL